MITCSFSIKAYHTPSKSGRSQGQRDQSEGVDLENTMGPSQRLSTCPGKVHKAKVNGPGSLQKTLQFGADPLGLQVFIFFIFYFLFTYCFVQTNYIFIKSQNTIKIRKD